MSATEISCKEMATRMVKFVGLRCMGIAGTKDQYKLGKVMFLEHLPQADIGPVLVVNWDDGTELKVPYSNTKLIMFLEAPEGMEPKNENN